MSRRAVAIRALGALTAVLAVLVTAAPSAEAHAAFLGSTPAPGSRVESPPSAITLRFTEALNARLSEAKLVIASTGRTVPARVTARGRTLVLSPLRPLARGAYRLEWHTVSTGDAHPLEGSFGVGVQAGAGNAAAATEESPLASAGWVRALVRALLYAALLAFAGALLLVVALGPRWLVPPVLEEHDTKALDLRAARRRERGLIVDLGLFAAALAAAAAVVESVRAARGASPAALRDYLLANPAGLARVAVVAFLAVAVVASVRRPRLAALAAVAALGAVVASGHADSADPRIAAVAADWIHLVAGAVWVGGIALIAIVWGPWLRGRGSEGRTAVARHVLSPFGSLALPAFVVVAVAGTVNAAIELGRLSALWETSYGAVLLVKILLVVALALASYMHALRLRPRLLGANPHPPERLDRRHWRLVRGEPLLVVGILGAAGLLVAFPLPPRQSDAAAEARRGVPACDPCPLPAPGPDELAVADQTGSHVVAAWIRRRQSGVSATIRVLDFRGRPSKASLQVAGARLASCGQGCATLSLSPAAKTLRVGVRDRGRTAVAALPATWSAGGAERARALLDRAERTMRALRSVRQLEEVTSGPGTFARTRYALRAPNRMAYTTDRGVEAVMIGNRRWFRTGVGPWQKNEAPGDIPFRTSGFFRWTPYASSIQLLSTPGRGAGRRRVAEVALMDPGTPVWTRLVIDTRTGRVLHERLVARSRSVVHRNFDFDAPVFVTAPREAIGRAG